MATLPTDVNDTPNYTSSQHADHHNELHATHNDFDGETPALIRARSSHTGTQTVSTLSDHDKAAHDALNIDADTVDGQHASAFAASSHASTHNDGGADELTAQSLGSGAAAANKVMETDGSGGWTLIDTPSGGTDSDAIHDNVASEISAITAKASPTSSDFLLIEDAAASNAKKRITIGDLPTGSLPTVTDSGEVMVSNSGGTAFITIQSRGEHVNAWLGTQANTTLDIQAAIDALPNAGGMVFFGNQEYDLGTDTQTDSESRTTHLIVPPGVVLRGAGSGSIQEQSRPGQATQAGTRIVANGSGAYLMVLHDGESGNNNASWPGYGVRDIHFGDGSASANQLDGFLKIQQGNITTIQDCSFGDLTKASSVAIGILQAPGGQTTQYGRIINCRIDVDHGGIEWENNCPDWIIENCSIISRLDSSPSSQSFGLKANTSKLTVYNSEIQFWDRAIWAVATDGEAKHHTYFNCHFEGHQSASNGTYEAMIFVDKSDSSTVSGFMLVDACEGGNSAKYDYSIKIDDGSAGTFDGLRVQNWRVRGTRWMTSGDAELDPGTRSSIEVV